MIDQQYEANKFMVTKLVEQIEDSIITDTYDVNFITNMSKVLKYGTLTINQQKFLDKLFHHKY